MSDDHERRPVRPAAGFTLVELLMASVVVGVGLVSTTWAMSSAARTNELLTEQPFTAGLLAREIRELAETLPREPSGLVGVTAGAGVVALDSLHGAVFNPPILADANTDLSLPNWTQEVSLALYALDDLETPTAEDPALGVPANSERLYQLRVTILQDGAELDTFRWWLRP